MRKNLLFLLALPLLTFCIASCSIKNDSPSTAILKVYLTDAPADYEEVKIDLQKVEYNTTDDAEKGWVSLTAQPTVYDLLKLSGGSTALIAYSEMSPLKIKQLRLVLGTKNTLKVEGKEYPLETPSAQQSGLKIKFDVDMRAGSMYMPLLDFDAAKSIVKAGDKYILKPVIKVANNEDSGIIKGKIRQSDVKCFVKLYNNKDTFNTYTKEGIYAFYMKEGTYKLKITPPVTSQYLVFDSEKDIVLKKGENITLDLIDLKKKP